MLDLLPNPLSLKTQAPDSPFEMSEVVTLAHHGWATLPSSGNSERYRLVKRLDDAKWSAVRLERDRLSANFQGNPLWPHQVLQTYKQLSDHFGLEGAYTADACLLPSVETINQKLNSIGLGDFTFQNAGEITLTDQAYVDAFIDDGYLPMAAPEDRDSIHDWSYHFLTLLFTDYLENVRLNLAWIRKNIGVFEGQVVRNWNYYGHRQDTYKKFIGEIKPEAMDWADAIYRQMAISLDVCTAKIVQILCMEQRGLLEKCSGELNIVSIFSNGVTDESLARILWLEPEPDSILSPPAVGAGRKYPPCAMTYIKAKLSYLEQKATTQISPELSAERAQFFDSILSNV